MSTYIGTNKLKSAYIGTTKVKSIYLGTNKVYSSKIPVTLNLTGSGNTSYCYVTINGTKRYSAGSYQVTSGDVVTFGVYGYSATYYGNVTIDDVEVLHSTGRTTLEYQWTVPNDKAARTIQLVYTSTSTRRNGRITVS